MEPIAAQNHPIAIRPIGTRASVELSSLLREGRVLAGEVLSSMADGSVLVGIGRHKVPAQTDLRLDPGRRFLFQVVTQGGEVVLRILGGGGAGSGFWSYLRDLVGLDRPLGDLLQEVAARARAELARPEGADGAEALRRLLDGLESRSRPPQGALELRDGLRRSGLAYEAALRALAARGVDRDLALELGRDLKAHLLRALAELPEGPAREVVARALAGLEAEQLLNLARAHSGEPQVLSLPLADGDGWTTARLLVQPRREQSGGARKDDGEDGAGAPHRVVLGLTLSRLGALRADVAWSPDRCAVRLSAERPDTVERLRALAPVLSAALGSDGRPARVAVARAGPAELGVGDGLADIALLRDHHIMDVSG